MGKPLREGYESTDEKEEPEFEVDLRIEENAQDAILKDEERMGKIKVVVGKLKIGDQTKEEHPIVSTKRKVKISTSKATLSCTSWDKYPEPSSAILV